MFKFNNTHIFTGYLKQLLHKFNLPKIKIYTTEQQDYVNKTGVEKNVIGTITRDNDVFNTTTQSFTANYDIHMKYVPYIKDNKIQEYINGEWKDVGGYIENNRIILETAETTELQDNTIIQKDRVHEIPYVYGANLLNYTKNLIIKGNDYDSYTHEYLGDYLRFLRDYKHIDLMPLYNCFSNAACDKINISGSLIKYEYTYTPVYTSSNANTIPTLYTVIGKYKKIKNTNNTYTYIEITDEILNRYDDVKYLQDAIIAGAFEICERSSKAVTINDKSGKPVQFTFNTYDDSYKIYAIPIKLFNKYTIAMDSELPIEMCCVLYGDYYDDRAKFSKLPNNYNIAENTYLKVASCHFNTPFIYDKVLNLTEEALYTRSSVELAQNEEDLKLLLKVPVNSKSTIIILEGDYRNWNDTIYKNNNSKTKINPNHSVVNMENINKYNNPTLISSLQLLKANIGQQVPFADRLVEYLTGNVISGEDNITDDIERAQTVMLANQANINKTIPSTSPNYVKPIATNNYFIPGAWEDKMRVIAYEYIQNHYMSNSEVNHDVLGYIDKDIEDKYVAVKANGDKTSISNADIYQEEQMWRRIVNGKF